MDNNLELRAIIIDDEKRGISALKQLVEKFVTGVKVIAECTQASKAIELIENYKPEIIFLDINMPGMNGFEMLEHLAWKNFSLVFTTAHEEYALKAIKNNAIDYLLKPISHKELVAATDKIKRRVLENNITIEFNHSELFSIINKNQKRRIIINSLTDVESIQINNILLLESKSNYTKILLLNNEEILTRKTLKEFEQQLCMPPFNFMRVHNSFVINLDSVARYLKVEDMIVMNNDRKIPLAKSRKDVFYGWLNV